MQVSEPLEVSGVSIEQIDIRSLSDADVVALNAFNNLMLAESEPDDPPRPVEITRANVDNLSPFDVINTFWARDPDGSLAAMADTFWTQSEDNKHVCQAEIKVRPDRRRRGIAKTLLRLIVDVAESAGRPRILAGSSDRVPAGETFARRVGAEPGLAVHTNRLLISDVDRELVRRWVDEGPSRAPKYSIITVDGRYPDDLLLEIVDLGHVMNTAPRDELDMEDRVTTPEMMREWEKSWLASGSERWGLFARHEPTGALVGWTEVQWNPAMPKTVWQWGTGVRPEHRGHALGKWLKATMLQRILETRPQVVDVRTGNADSNDAMLGINHQLGFKPYEAATWWQVKVDEVRAYLDASSV